MKDQIDLSTVTILNSPDVRDWPITATLERLELRPTGVHVEHTKQSGDDSWPDVAYLTPGEPLQYTLWIVLMIAGQWYASGCIEFWRGLDENGGPPEGYAEHWYYDAQRWAPMTGHQPAIGEEVGFFVTAGDARNNGQAIVHERSQVVTLFFPDAHGLVWNLFDQAPPAPPIRDDHTPVDGDDVKELLVLLEQAIDALAVTTQAVTGLSERLGELQAHGVKVHP